MKCCTVILPGNTGSCVELTNSCRLAVVNTRYKVGWINVLLFNSVYISHSDVEREEKQLRYYQVKLEAAETKLRDFEKYFSEQEDQSDLTKKLIDERESQTLKIFHLSEKLKIVLEREQSLKAEVQEAKDQSELLEFRVLELEECQEKEKVIKQRIILPAYQFLSDKNQWS